MRYRYRYLEIRTDELVSYLESMKIKYSTFSYLDREERVYFDIYDSDKRFDSISECLGSICRKEPFKYLEFNEADRRNAKLLRLYPKRQCIDITNEEFAFRPICRIRTLRGDYYTRHDKQISDIQIANEPSMKSSTAIWSISTGFDSYFTDTRVRALAENEHLTGLAFRNVLLKGNRVSENLYQLLSDHVLQQECFVPHKVHRCSVCGMQILDIGADRQLYMDFTKFALGFDFYMSGNFFGSSAGTTEPCYLISQRFYQLLKQNKLSGGLNCIPIYDINNY